MGREDISRVPNVNPKMSPLPIMVLVFRVHSWYGMVGWLIGWMGGCLTAFYAQIGNITSWSFQTGNLCRSEAGSTTNNKQNLLFNLIFVDVISSTR